MMLDSLEGDFESLTSIPTGSHLAAIAPRESGQKLIGLEGSPTTMNGPQKFGDLSPLDLM